MKNKLKIYLLAPDKNVLSQFIVIKTPNDKIIVVDGGHIEFEPCLAPAIRAILGKKDDDYFEIDVWFISHAHEDHYGELIKLLGGQEQNANFKVNNFYFDFPDFEKTSLTDYRPQEITLLKQVFDRYALLNGIKVDGNYYDYLNGRVINRQAVQKGLTITIDGVHFDILQTHSDIDEQVNANSLVIRIRFNSESGLKKILLLNDVTALSGKRLMDKYGKELKSDIVQLAHHGQRGAEKELYDIVDAKIRLWPTPYWVWINPKDFDIGKTREWFNIEESGDSENDLISCLYKDYPTDRTKAEDWVKCVEKMMIEI